MSLDILMFVLAGVLTMLAFLTGQFALLVAALVCAGLGYGGVPPTNSAIISDFFGRKNFALNYPIVNTNLLIASFSSAFAGSLFDATGTYASSVVFVCVPILASIFALAVMRRPNETQ